MSTENYLPSMTSEEVAAEYGRSADWLHRHWRTMVQDGKLPAPVAAAPIAWNRAQVYAYLDARLPDRQREYAAAFRAARHAAQAAPTDAETQDWQRRLDARFGVGT